MMHTKWAAHIEDDEAKTSFISLVRNSVTVLSRLLTILIERKTSLENQEVDPKKFKDPSWALEQAFLAGRRYELRQTMTLLDFLNTK